tara:strand:+ start:314 stop:1255 length:942 start_codon:yes stop_codon:yes gene_type:complete
MSDFHAATTTKDVLTGICLKGQTILITGASTGLGLASAIALAEAGADLILTARSEEKFLIARDAVLVKKSDAIVHFCELRLEDIASCKQAAIDINHRFTNIDHIIANAGVMACNEQRTNQGYEWQFGVNHLGHFAFINNIIGLLTSDDCRVAVLTSGGHRLGDVDLVDPNFNQQPYDKWLSYGRAKTANALYALALNKRMPFGRANAVHPGAITTELSRHLTQDDFASMGSSMKDSGIMMKSIDAGAATQVWAVTSPELDGRGGLYLEDCQVGIASDDHTSGYASYIMSQDNAEKLWHLSEQLVGQSFNFAKI